MATITVKNIPDDLYDRLKLEAEENRRSINSEIIQRIERSLRSTRIPAEQVLARVKRLRDSFGDQEFTVEQLDSARREGRA